MNFNVSLFDLTLSRARLTGLVSLTAFAASTLFLAPSAFAQEYTLKFQPETGKSQRYEMNTIQDIQIDMGQMGQQKIQSTSVMEITQSARQDGPNYLVETSFDRMTMSAQQGGNSVMDFDSKTDTADGSNPLGSVVGQTFQIRINPQGEIQGLEGMDDVWEQALSEVQGSAPESAAMFQQIKESMGDDQMAEMMQSGMAVFPDRPVRVGESWDWKTTQNNPMFGQVSLDLTYTLKGMSNQYSTPCLELGVELDMKMEGGGAMIDQILAMAGGEGSFESEDIQGNGMFCIDEKTGGVVHSEMNQLIKMTMDLSMGEQSMTMGMAIDQKIVQRLLN